MKLLNIVPLALSASAFLIPTEVTGPVEVIDKIPDIARLRNIILDCVDGCPIGLAAGVKGGVPQVWVQDGNKVKLLAEVEVIKNRVYLNGKEIWPTIPTTPLQIKQKQLRVPGQTFYNIYEEGIPVASSIDYKAAEYLVDSTTNMKIQPISIEILGIANLEPMIHAQSFEIRIAQTEAGVGLLSSKIVPYKASPAADHCTTIPCRLREAALSKFREFRDAAVNKFRGWRGCAGKKLHGQGGPIKFGPGSSLAPNHHHGHHGHHGHHHGGIRGYLRMFYIHFVRPSMFMFLIVSSVFVFAIPIVWFRVMMIVRRNRMALAEQAEAEEGAAGLPPTYDEIYREPQAETENEKEKLLQ